MEKEELIKVITDKFFDIHIKSGSKPEETPLYQHIHNQINLNADYDLAFIMGVSVKVSEQLLIDAWRNINQR